MVEIAIRKFEALLCFTRNESFGAVTSGGHFETGRIRDKRQFGYLKLTRSKKHVPRVERVDKDVSPSQAFVYYWPEKLPRGSWSNWTKGDSDCGIFDRL